MKPGYRVNSPSFVTDTVPKVVAGQNLEVMHEPCKARMRSLDCNASGGGDGMSVAETIWKEHERTANAVKVCLPTSCYNPATTNHRERHADFSQGLNNIARAMPLKHVCTDVDLVSEVV